MSNPISKIFTQPNFLLRMLHCIEVGDGFRQVETKTVTLIRGYCLQVYPQQGETIFPDSLTLVIMRFCLTEKFVIESLYSLKNKCMERFGYRITASKSQLMTIVKILLAVEYDCFSVASFLNDIGYELSTLEQTKEALKVHNQALEMYKRIYKDSDHVDIANSLNGIGCALDDLSQYQEALFISKR